MNYDFCYLWDKLNFTTCGISEYQLINTFKKVANYLIEKDIVTNDEVLSTKFYKYEYREVGKVVGHDMFGWCVINMLAQAKFIDWENSIQEGWITELGNRFFHYILKYPTDYLFEATFGEFDIEEIERNMVFH